MFILLQNKVLLITNMGMQNKNSNVKIIKKNSFINICYLKYNMISLKSRN